MEDEREQLTKRVDRVRKKVKSLFCPQQNVKSIYDSFNLITVQECAACLLTFLLTGVRALQYICMYTQMHNINPYNK